MVTKIAKSGARQKTARRPGRIGVLIEDYLRACRARGVRSATLDAYGFPLRGVLLPWLAEEGIDDPAALDKKTIESFAVHLREDGGAKGVLSENTIWTYIRGTNQFMRWLAEEGIGDGATVRQRTPPSRRVDVLDREDVHALVRAARTERDAVIVQLLADSAMRPGELVSLRGRDLKKDSRRFWVTVRGKSGERDVPVAKDLWTRLGRLGAKDDPERALFIGLRRDPRTGEREALTPNGVLQLVQGLGKDCGLKQNVTPYVFRHSGCRWMLLNGMSTVAVAQIMGHGSERMIRLHYANLGRNDSYDQLIGLLKDHG